MIFEVLGVVSLCLVHTISDGRIAPLEHICEQVVDQPGKVVQDLVLYEHLLILLD